MCVRVVEPVDPACVPLSEGMLCLQDRVNQALKDHLLQVPKHCLTRG